MDKRTVRYLLHLLKHSSVTPAIFKKYVSNPINMLSEGKKIFSRSFLIDLLNVHIF